MRGFFYSIIVLSFTSLNVDAGSITVNESGQDGVNGSRGHPGESGRNGRDGSRYGGSFGRSGESGSYGADGQDASDATSGTDAKSIDASISIDENKIVEVDANGIVHREQVDQLSGIYLKAVGGKGGNGGEGGPGGRGGNGGDGADADRDYEGGDGGDAGYGGRGGVGGSAGFGGNGGDIRVQVSDSQSYLLWYVTMFNRGGEQGSAGKGGNGGSAGSAGDGGTSYNREGIYRRAGDRGRSAASGPQGKPGRMATGSTRNGLKRYALVTAQGVKEYSSPFSVVIESLQLEESQPDGILEPGEQVKLLSMTLANEADMPTPKGLGLKIRGLGFTANGVVGNDEISIAEDLAGKQRTKVDFSGSNLTQIIGEKLGDKPFRPMLSFNGVSREIDLLQSDLEIKNPVQFEALSKNLQVIERTSSTLQLKVRNISTAALGGQSASGRKVIVRLRPLTTTPAFKLAEVSDPTVELETASKEYPVLESKQEGLLDLTIDLKADKPLYSETTYAAEILLTKISVNPNTEPKVITSVPVKVISKISDSRKIDIKQNVKPMDIKVKYVKNGKTYRVKTLWFVRDPNSNSNRVQYDLDSLFDPDSPKYYAELPELSKWLPKVLEGKEFSKEDVIEILQSIVKPRSDEDKDWEIDSIQ